MPTLTARAQVTKIEEEHRLHVERLKVESSLLEQKLQKQESAHQIAIQHEIQKVLLAPFVFSTFSLSPGGVISSNNDASSDVCVLQGAG